LFAFSADISLALSRPSGDQNTNYSPPSALIEKRNITVSLGDQTNNYSHPSAHKTDNFSPALHQPSGGQFANCSFPASEGLLLNISPVPFETTNFNIRIKKEPDELMEDVSQSRETKVRNSEQDADVSKFVDAYPIGSGTAPNSSSVAAALALSQLSVLSK
jgi:hypothetical protein